MQVTSINYCTISGEKSETGEDNIGLTPAEIVELFSAEIVKKAQSVPDISIK